MKYIPGTSENIQENIVYIQIISNCAISKKGQEIIYIFINIIFINNTLIFLKISFHSNLPIYLCKIRIKVNTENSYKVDFNL